MNRFHLSVVCFCELIFLTDKCGCSSHFQEPTKYNSQHARSLDTLFLDLGYVHTWFSSTSARDGVPKISTPLECPSARSRPFTRAQVRCQNSGVGHLKKGVFTLCLSDNRTRAPCSGTKYEHNLRPHPLILNTSIQFNSILYLHYSFYR